jgi:hypothetical protein
MKVVQFTVPVVYQGSICVQKTFCLHSIATITDTEIQLTYILKGRGTFMIGNFTYFEEDEIYIVDADEPHMFKTGKI